MPAPDAEFATHYGPIRPQQSRDATHLGRDRMLRYPRCIAPALLASFVALIATAAARAEPASAASPADADCLVKPNGQAAPGNHWYYHLDRASGRRCWYQRAEIAAPSSTRHDATPSRTISSRSASS